MATTRPMTGASRRRRGWGSMTPELFPERAETQEFRTTEASSGMYLRLRIGGGTWVITAVNPQTHTSRAMDAGSSESQASLLTMANSMASLGSTYGVSWLDLA